MISGKATPIDHATPQTVGKHQITLAHGGGGQLTDELIERSILPRLGNDVLSELMDSGVFSPGQMGSGDRLAMTIDGYVVQPLEFPGGDIGRLCISGTVNDLAVSGAEPLGIALGLVLTEGLDRALLERVLDSIAATAAEAGVKVITGDTKVVGHGQGDGIFITTSGVGLVRGTRPSMARVQPGDLIIINGPIADHGLSVMLAREMPDVRSVIRSDVAPLNGLIARLRLAVPNLAFMRDATRAGLSGLAADLASKSGWHVSLDEQAIPVRPETHHAAEMLGLDPLDVANEGKVVVVVRPEDEKAALDALRSDPLGRESRLIGVIESARDGLCDIRTELGGRRIIQKPYGEQLPRIC